MRFELHTGFKKTLLGLHHGQKPRSELTNSIRDGKSFLSNWSELSVPAESRPKLPAYVARNSDGKVSNHLVMARMKADENTMIEISPTKKNLVIIYLFKIFEKIYIKKIPKKTTNRNKRNRTYSNHRHRKNKTLKICFRSNYISEGEKSRTSIEDRRRHHSKKPTLLEKLTENTSSGMKS